MMRTLPRFLALIPLLLLTAACGSSEGDEPSDTCSDSCLFAPQSVCDGTMLSTFASPGVCLTGECQFIATTQDCAVGGGTCANGACVPPTTDACDGVACDAPPAAACEADTRVTYAAAGICEGGSCSYTRNEQNCSATNQVCIEATCVDPGNPCATITCNMPAAPRCDGDTAIAQAATGECIEEADSARCEYAETATDCEAAGQVCSAGACVETDPCDGVMCQTPPAASCDGEVIVSYSPLGLCSEGECSYTENRTDCGANRLLCVDAECVARPDCFEVVCDRPPAASCLGDTARVFDDVGACSANRCSYELTEIDCAAGGEICEGGTCVSPTVCTGVECTTPPPRFCSGDNAVSFSFPGACDDGVCRYDQITADCAAAGGFCSNGECEFDTSCDAVNCSRLPAAGCDGDDVLVEYFPISGGPDCEGGRCLYNEVRTECGVAELCLDGECVAFDACDFIDCIAPDFCEGSVAVQHLAPGTCEDGMCDYGDVQQRLDCAVDGLTCLDGGCVTAASLLDVGDVALSEVFFELDVVPPAQWLEVKNQTETALLVGGLIISIDGTELELPAGTTIPASGALVVSTPGSDAEAVASFVASFEVTLTSTVEIIAGDTGIVLDEVVFTPAFPQSDVTTASLDPNADHLTNDAAASWCFSSGIYVPAGSPTAVNSPCAPLPAGTLLVPTELMVDGPFGAGGTEQYIEFFNATDAPIALAGARLDTGGEVFVVPADVVVGAESYVVFAAGPSMAGGVAAATWGAGTRLDAGEALLTYGDATLVLLEWDASFPFVTGASVEYAGNLFDPEYDAGEFWCTGRSDIPGLSPNLGSPGRASECAAD